MSTQTNNFYLSQYMYLYMWFYNFQILLPTLTEDLLRQFLNLIVTSILQKKIKVVRIRSSLTFIFYFLNSLRSLLIFSAITSIPDLHLRKMLCSEVSRVGATLPKVEPS